MGFTGFNICLAEVWLWLGNQVVKVTNFDGWTVWRIAWINWVFEFDINKWAVKVGMVCLSIMVLIAYLVWKRWNMKTTFVLEGMELLEEYFVFWLNYAYVC